jgi:hypothetical protein
MECLSPLSLQGQNTSIPNTQYENTENKVENALVFELGRVNLQLTSIIERVKTAV